MNINYKINGYYVEYKKQEASLSEKEKLVFLPVLVREIGWMIDNQTEGKKRRENYNINTYCGTSTAMEIQMEKVYKLLLRKYQLCYLKTFKHERQCEEYSC